MNLARSEQTHSLIRSPILWGLMLFSFCLSSVLAYLLNIRFDEAFTLNTTSQDVGYAFRQAITFEQQAPLYFVLLSIWRNIDSSIFFARLFSVLCFPLFVWVSAEVSKRYVKDVNPLVIATVVAVHQQVVWSALDIRLYSLMLLLSGLLLLFFYDGYLDEKPRRSSRILYVIVAVLSLYTQYYLGFQLVAGAVVLMMLRRWRPALRYFIDMSIAGVIFVPMLFVITGQVSDLSGQMDSTLSGLDFVKAIYQRIVPLFISVEWIEFEFLKRWIARIVVFTVSVLFLRKLLKKRSSEDVTISVTAIALSLFFLATYYQVGDQSLQIRHMSGLLLPVVLLSFSAFSFFGNKRVIYAWLTLLVCLSLGSLYAAYKPLAKPGDFARVAQYVMTNEGPGQPVFVFHADAAPALAHYYKGQNPLLAIPREPRFDAWNPRNNVLRDEGEIVDLLNRQSGASERLWLVHDGWCAQGSLSFNCQILEDVVAKYFETESTQAFLEPTTVRLLRRK